MGVGATLRNAKLTVTCRRPFRQPSRWAKKNPGGENLLITLKIDLWAAFRAHLSSSID